MSRWRIGEAAVEELLRAGELQHLVGQAANGGPWLEKARRTLETAQQVAAADPSSAYVLAYDAARQACVGLLAEQGLRPTTRGGHFAVERAVVAQFRDAFAAFGSLRRRRNRIEYPTELVDDVSGYEIDEALAAVAAIVDKAAVVLPSLGLFGG